MDKLVNSVGVAFSVVTGSLYSMMGGDENLITTLFVVMLIDFISGTIKALYNRNFCSDEIYKGALKKMSYIVMIVLANRLNISFGDVINMEVPLTQTVIVYFIYLDSVSSVENIGSFVEYSDAINQFLKKLNGGNKDGKNS